MTRLVALPLLLALLAPASAPLAQDRAGGGTELVGSWLVGCQLDRMTDEARCRMLHQAPVAPAASGLAALTLEVEDRGGRLVPVVAARDLSLEGSLRGVLALTGTVQLRFPPGRYFEMPCGLEGRSLVCAPREADRDRAAAELPGAEQALLRVTGFLVPEAQAIREPVTLRLAGTAAALARLRAQQPEGLAPRPEPPPLWDLREMLARLLALLGPLGSP